jgi:HPt (histidine-containing phosphotransfer) domain-containing protein
MPETIDKMDFFLVNERIKDFAIEIHGIKGVFRSIGISSLAAKAALLETAALNNDKNFITEKYPPFLSELNEFIGLLNDALSDDANIHKEFIDFAKVSDTIKKAKTAAEGYDALAAADLLNPLLKYSFENGAEEFVQKAVHALEEFNCAGALEYLEKILN